MKRVICLKKINSVPQVRIGLLIGILRQHVYQRDERIKRGCESLGFILHVHVQKSIIIEILTRKTIFLDGHRHNDEISF